ncbi:carboxypeptidase regulatory-like domain-containing protein [Pseudomonas sp. NPDC090233]|uniref:carboxypeptidase regulatory-like domain-containing protein n=1 Tax=Pseudomonas sp. NPDC090233 TaxID=3364479 RepID=UPI00383B2F9F
MRNHHYALGATLMLALVFPWTLAAAADLNAPIDMQAVQLQPQEQNGIRYLQGGIGQDEANALRKTTGYDLHVELSTGPEGKFQSGASVDIQNAQGEPVLSVQDVGPLLYVQLPPGQYTVIGQAEGSTVRQQTTVNGTAPVTVNLNWR